MHLKPRTVIGFGPVAVCWALDGWSKEIPTLLKKKKNLREQNIYQFLLF